MKAFIELWLICILSLKLMAPCYSDTRCGLFKPVFVLNSDFSVQTTLTNIQNQMMCQVRTNMLKMSAYHFDYDSSECKIGNISATLPSIAKDELGQITVWALPQTQVLHVMTLIQQSSYREFEDFSFNKDLSRPLQNNVRWIPDDFDIGTLSYWKYRGGVLFCGTIECYLKSTDDQPATWFANLTGSRVYPGGYGFLNGKPWIFGGYDNWGTDKTALMVSEILEPWGEWVPGPVLSYFIKGGVKGCVEDIGNSTMLIAGTSSGRDYWLYNRDNDEWTIFSSYLSMRIQYSSCTQVTHPTTGRKLVMMPGGRTKVDGVYQDVDKVFLFDIETRTWSEDGPQLPVKLSTGNTLGPADGLDTVYRLSKTGWGNVTVLRLREDFSGWDAYPDWELGDGLDANIQIPLIYTG